MKGQWSGLIRDRVVELNNELAMRAYSTWLFYVGYLIAVADTAQGWIMIILSADVPPTPWTSRPDNSIQVNLGRHDRH